MSDLYEGDILEWSEQQAALLRRLANGERVNDLDWPNIVEEIESVGRSELHSVEGLLVQAITHILKADAWPNSPYVDHWRAEARRFRSDATARYSPSMRQRIEIARLFRRELLAVPATIRGEAPLPLPTTCPVSLDELLAEA